ncbi:hypothetical protein CERZMDRAFT_84994 [Cercospora zeae-maydis SCOH1-5]|uniref:Uncharacterized protein n=1 Tax=Cercospora zeae-maydis SCOH1-5 TaxID=717836 RepID=A0A6A6FF76_9PEZI|nr:hypothetical protein CERZMDRAFT_84994 [Cercospora zeae-maydis SCOH1-5]
MYLKNIIACTAALMLSHAVAYPAQPMPRVCTAPSQTFVEVARLTKSEQDIQQNGIAARAPAVEHYNNPARRDEQAKQAVQAKHVSKVKQAMQDIQSGQEMTEEQARNDYPFAFELGGPTVDDFDDYYFNPDAEYYGFGPGKSDDGTVYNLGYYQYNFNSNGVALQTPYGTYDVTRGKWADDRPSNWSVDDFDDDSDDDSWFDSQRK